MNLKNESVPGAREKERRLLRRRKIVLWTIALVGVLAVIAGITVFSGTAFGFALAVLGGGLTAIISLILSS